ncbi:DUF1541 domain-containing protein [Jeotgalibacillus sp. S-D1]|uniref:YdhK family protein n=1 Tax=Jeotgalibacillus sp. S-D1 TaxID=2552189 RepID=UPI00105A38BC|nr:YdhK family protein [Jeotgalibacillus sp. S-D1]TDL31380.1 DUF1541 domain-containing protein [Jeotgalibacillus sp. S-D1]
MYTNKILFSLAAASVLLVAAGCSDQSEEGSNNNEHDQHVEMSENESIEMDHSMHSGSGELPEGLQEAADPAYEVGSKALINTDHMPGMNGAEAEISGAFDTIAYAVTYTPADGGEPVENHKWVIQEELEGLGDELLEPGTEVTLEADHMEGMDGAAAEIVSAEKTTVYMVDFVPTDSEEKVENHKWVTENELSLE